MVTELPRVHPRKGRGAPSQPPCRYERETRIAIDDGWWRDDCADPPPAA